MIELLEKLMLIVKEVDMDEKEKWFEERTYRHIALVQKAARKVAGTYPDEFSVLIDIVEDHDASKFEEPERTPYIELTWNKKNNIKAKPELQKDITIATLHHIKNNAHHPEYWLEDKTKANLSSTNRDESIECVDASNMDDIAIAEMVCDWVAMSEELQTNTAREWYNDVKDVRWHFSDKQDKLIDRLLIIFENV